MSCEFVSVSSPDLAGLSGLVLGDDESVGDTTLRLARNIDGSLVETADAKVSVTVTERKIAPWALPWYAETALFDAISYVPNDDQVQKILEKGKQVVESTVGDANPTMRVKTGYVDGVKQYTDDAPRDPTKSAWFEYDLITEDQRKKYDTENTKFVVVPDKDAPMSKTSMGMNGLLARFDDKNAKRVNLFVGSEDDVFELLGEFLAFRCRHQDTIVEQTIGNMHESKPQPQDGSARASPSKLLDLALEVKRADSSTTFASLGIGLRSFCQTWDFNDGEPNFSQQSPHFQTKVVVRDAARLFEALRTYAGTKDTRDLCETFKEYGERVLALRKAFVANGYEKSFVDLDELYARMTRTRELDAASTWVLSSF